MIFLAALQYAILASTFTLGKLAVLTCHPLFLIGIRMLCAGPLLLFFHKLSKASLKIKKEDSFLFIKVAIFHILIPFCFEFWSLQYISSAKTSIIYSLTPFIAAVLSFFILKKRYSWQQVVGLFLGLFGLLPMFMAKGDLEHFAGEFLFISIPEVVLLLAVISASYAWFLVSDLMKKGYGIGLINGVSMLIGGALSLLIWSLFFSDVSPIYTNIYDFVLWTGLLIIVANLICYNFYGWLLKHLSISLMSMTGFLCPIFASFYGWFFLGEEVGIVHLIACSMVIFGLFIFYRSEVNNKISSFKALD